VYKAIVFTVFFSSLINFVAFFGLGTYSRTFFCSFVNCKWSNLSVVIIMSLVRSYIYNR